MTDLSKSQIKRIEAVCPNCARLKSELEAAKKEKDETEDRLLEIQKHYDHVSAALAEETACRDKWIESVFKEIPDMAQSYKKMVKTMNLVPEDFIWAEVVSMRDRLWAFTRATDQCQSQLATAIRERDEARTALKEIAEHPHCQYGQHECDKSSESDRLYAVGASDGHRCAAETARKALGKGSDDRPVDARR